MRYGWYDSPIGRLFVARDEIAVRHVTIVEMLVGMIVARGDKSIIENVDNLKRCRREMDEYWPDEQLNAMTGFRP